MRQVFKKLFRLLIIVYIDQTQEEDNELTKKKSKKNKKKKKKNKKKHNDGQEHKDKDPTDEVNVDKPSEDNINVPPSTESTVNQHDLNIKHSDLSSTNNSDLVLDKKEKTEKVFDNAYKSLLPPIESKPAVSLDIDYDEIINPEPEVKPKKHRITKSTLKKFSEVESILEARYKKFEEKDNRWSSEDECVEL